MKFFYLLIIFSVLSCSSRIPKIKYQQSTININISFINDTLLLFAKNTLHCPYRIFIIEKTNNDTLKEFIISPLDSIQIKDTTLYTKKKTLKYDTAFGDPYKTIYKNELAFPFSKNLKYKILQGYNGSFSHNTSYSRYALDFNLKVGDTICAADDGFVVGVIKDYKKGGSSKKWEENDYSNFITIYHPHSGLFTQYVHLKHQKTFVKVGDQIKKGEAIGLSGMTGFTDSPHLHFNVLIPKKGKTLISTPMIFENDIKGENLKNGMSISH